MTVLRLIMALPSPASTPVQELGIDDFALRRGRRYGTILVDLTTHRIIDLLPERSATSAGNWLRQHPEISLISRDRGKEFAQACREQALQTIAVADRFHLLSNLIEGCEPAVGRALKALRHSPLPALSSTEWRPAKNDHEEERLTHQRARKRALFEQVHA